MKGRVKNSVVKIPGFQRILLILLVPLAGTICRAQTQQPADPKGQAKFFSEKLFVTTDRDLYVCGEKVWLKIYKTDALTHLQENESKVVYVDILDPDNNPVEQLKLETEASSGSGSFILPDTLRTGNYLLRSYTIWMQNFSKDFYACKTISVINPFEKISDIRIPETETNPDSVIFFPEGGYLLAGNRTKLGFRTFGKNGNPVPIRGYLIDERQDTLTVVHTGINGYGFTELTPEAESRVYLTTAYKNQLKKFLLPAAEEEGVVLSSSREDYAGPALATMKFSPGYEPGGKKLFLNIDAPGLSVITREVTARKDSEITFTRDDLPEGLLYMELTDDQQRVISDLWISNENRSGISYSIKPVILTKGNRGQIKVNILASDSKGNPVESDLSVSIAKAAAIDRSSIHMEAGKQLPGIKAAMEDCNITDPGDYLIFFISRDESKGYQGNSRNNFPLYTPELEGHLISGNVRDRVSGQPLRNENITLSFVGKTARCLFTRTDENGNFNFVTREKGLQEIVIQPLTYTNEVYVDLTNPFQTSFNNYDHGIFIIDTSRLEGINNVIVSKQISDIYQTYDQKSSLRSVLPSGKNFYGKPDNSINMADYIELTSVREIIAELIPGVATTRNNGKINFRVNRPYQTKPYENGPLVLVDGVPVYDLEKVIGISAGDIDKVDVLLERYFIAGNALDGIVHFITKKGNLTAMEPDKSVFRMEYDLLQPEEDFYSPDYSADSVKNNHIPDFRNTLYWNPDLHTDATGRVTVDFYSSDESVPYVITVEGMSRDGIRGYASVPLIIR